MSATVTKKKPKTLLDFEKRFPAVWKSYKTFRDSCDEEGPLDQKSRELIKVALETAFVRRGGLIAHLHRARRAGASPREILHAILLAAPLVGFPPVLDAFQTAERHLK